MMHGLKFCILMFFVSISSIANTQSSILPVDSTEYKDIYSYILPSSLILGGSFLHLSRETKMDWQTSIRSSNPDFQTNIDNYIQYTPMVTLYLADVLGVKAKNSIWNQTKYLLISQILTSATVHSLKNTVLEPRPRGNNHSFPSGHTSQTFVGATVLYHEFKDTNPYIAYSGFIVGGAVAYLRVMNNAHWTSDVIAGAGISILITNLVYHFEPLKNWNPWKKKGVDLSVLPFGARDVYGMSVCYRM